MIKIFFVFFLIISSLFCFFYLIYLTIIDEIIKNTTDNVEVKSNKVIEHSNELKNNNLK